MFLKINFECLFKSTRQQSPYYYIYIYIYMGLFFRKSTSDKTPEKMFFMVTNPSCHNLLVWKVSFGLLGNSEGFKFGFETELLCISFYFQPDGDLFAEFFCSADNDWCVLLVSLSLETLIAVVVSQSSSYALVRSHILIKQLFFRVALR